MNPTLPLFDGATCVHQLFEQQVVRTPNAIALVCGGEALNYAELNARANRLAHLLVSMGVGPETAVGVCVARTPALVIAALAVQKAGGAYLPMDPGYPARRIAYMIEDSGVRVVLADSAAAAALAGASEVVRLDASPEANWPEANPNRDVPGRSLAYIIYTSGSTGNPKGVMVEHRNVANFFVGMDQLLGTRAGTWLAVTSLSFDISVLELFWTLSRGFKVVLYSGGAAGQSIDALLLRHGVSHFQCTPSMAGMLVRDPATAPALAGLERMLVGGEALSASLASDLCNALPAGTLTNMYGPTETTIWSMTHEVSAQSGPVPIGRPIANTQVYVLDAALNPLPVGVTGDLYIGGEGVARGYLKRPELTRERFIDDPFRSGHRLYQTGDLARHRADGTLEFRGRSDHQIKVRGFRIELEEVERGLADHPDVGQAAAALHGSSDAGMRLVAYLAPARAGVVPDPTSVRAHLLSQLPEYMMPDDFVILEHLPLTLNGKVDRKALPALERTAVAAAVFVAPETPTERTLARLWQEIFRVDRIGINDNIFDSGGNSLLAMRLATRIHDEFGVAVPLLTLFERPQLRNLAARIDDLAATGAARSEMAAGELAQGFEYGEV